MVELGEPSGVRWKGRVPNAALNSGVGVGENVGVDGFGVDFGGGHDERAWQADNVKGRSPEVGVFT